jgi:hypothetical protein
MCRECMNYNTCVDTHHTRWKCNEYAESNGARCMESL